MTVADTGIGLIGYPAAGKSYSVSVLEKSTIDCYCIAIGDVVRDIVSHPDILGSNPSGKAIRDWVTEKLNEDEESVIREVVSELNDREFEAETVVIDGIRTPADVRVLREEFQSFHLLYLDTPKSARLERIRNRGRAEEGEFTIEDLEARDAEEEQWGLKELVEEDVYDKRLQSYGYDYEMRLIQTVRKTVR